MSEVVDSTETPAAQPAADNSTSTEQMPPPTQSDAPAETDPPETNPAPEGEAAKTPPPFDKERQKKDQERANREKARDDEVAALKAQVAQLLEKSTAPQTPAQTQQAEAEADDINKMADEAQRLEEESERILSEDRFDEEKAKIASKLRTAAIKLRTSALKAAHAANLKQSENSRQLAEKLRQRDAKDADAQAATTFWRAWSQRPENAGIPLEKAQALNAECYQKAAAAGYQGEARSIRQTELFAEKLPTLKTTPPTTTAPKKTAAPASGTAPAGTKVTPTISGAQIDSHEMDEAGKALLAHFTKGQ